MVAKAFKLAWLSVVFAPAVTGAVPAIAIKGVPVRLDDKIVQLRYRGQTLDLRIDRLTRKDQAVLKKAVADGHAVSLSVIADAIEY